MKTASTDWQFWIDRGGTFTDIVACSPSGQLTTRKLLSENPRHYKDAAVEGIRQIWQQSSSDQDNLSRSITIKMGTTVATNALLERKGEPTLLVITRGFADALRIGYQNRPDLFSLNIKLPEMMYCSILEVDERINASADVLVELNESEVKSGLQQAYDSGLRSIAIVFMFGYLNTVHEKKVAKLAKSIGFDQISTSYQTSPLMKLVSRGDTTVVDAYLSPILKRYVSQLENELNDLTGIEKQLQFMRSSGGLTEAHRFDGKDAILSGPAGGVVGMVETALVAGFDRLIGFDMGGTSTDVCHYAGEYERSFDTEVAGVRMRAPMMRIHTVAAGGGSILSFDGSRYRVGPDSSGANPGPASYGNNGPLCVTDCNVMLGKLQPDYFPQVFGEDGKKALDKHIVEEKFNELANKIKFDTGVQKSPVEIATGFLSIAVENMANAIKKISVQRGYDVAHYTLCCFGGAGGQHACLVADALAIKRIFLHPYAGVLSAYGMGLANISHITEASIEKPLQSDSVSEIKNISEQLINKGIGELKAQAASVDSIKSIIKVNCYYQGSDTSIPVSLDVHSQMTKQFEQLLPRPQQRIHNHF